MHAHRFGVEQRSALALKNSPPPHVLAMTATPIPRTLALVAHGDLAHSTIDEMPAGRLPIETHVYPDQKKTRSKASDADMLPSALCPGCCAQSQAHTGPDCKTGTFRMLSIIHCCLTMFMSLSDASSGWRRQVHPLCVALIG